MKNSILLCFLLLMTSCAFVRSVSQTSIPAKKGRVVQAEATNHIILFLNFSNKHVDSITDKLIEQCPNGKISGILTKDEVIYYFPLIPLWYKEQITVKGYCNA